MPTEIYSSHHVMSPLLTPIKTPTDSQVPYYLLNYALLYISPALAHLCMPLIPLQFTTPIITQAHAPIFSPQKLLEFIIFNIEVHYTSINFIAHEPTHNYPNDSIQILVLSL